MDSDSRCGLQIGVSMITEKIEVMYRLFGVAAKTSRRGFCRWSEFVRSAIRNPSVHR
jgi:hypothetical protein